MPSASDFHVDAATSHAVALLRVGATMRVEALNLLVDLQSELDGTLKKMGDLPTYQGKQWQETKKAADLLIGEAYGLIGKTQDKSLSKIVLIEAKNTDATINKLVGVKVLDGQISTPLLSQLVKQPIVFGAPAAAWWDGQAEDLKTKFQSEIGKGILLGETNAQLRKRILGVLPGEANEGSLMAQKRRQAEALVRTSVISVSNSAKLASYEARKDIIKGIQWIATLDSRTTTTCRALDGLQWRFPDYEPVGHDKVFPGATAHWQCRSTQIPVLYSWAELSGKKLPSLDGATFEERVKAKLKAKGMSEEQLAKVTVNTRASLDGQVSNQTDFEGWAKTRTPDEIEAILGPGRFTLWKAGKITMADMTDQNNRPLSLNELEDMVDTGKQPPETLGVQFLPPTPPAKNAEVQKLLAEELEKQKEQAKKANKAKAANIGVISKLVDKDGANTDLDTLLQKVGANQAATLAAMEPDELDAWKVFWKAQQQKVLDQKAKEQAAKQAAIDAVQNDIAELVANPNKPPHLKYALNDFLKSGKPITETSLIEIQASALEKALIAKKYAAATSIQKKLVANPDMDLDTFFKKHATQNQKDVWDSLTPEESVDFMAQWKTAQETAKKAAEAAAAKAALTAPVTATAPDVTVQNLDLSFPDPSTLKVIKSLPGSTAPLLTEDPLTGKKWVQKSPDQGGGGVEHLVSEALADDLYRIAGVSVPGSKFIVSNGKGYKLSEYLEGSETLGAWESTATAAQKAAMHAEIRKGFVMDALLGNWDVAGQSNDNILVFKGMPIRVDNGGALTYRAMGSKKTAAEWKDIVNELQTLRDPSKSAGRTSTLFAGVTQAEIDDQIVAILKKKDAILGRAEGNLTKAEMAVFRSRFDYLEALLPESKRPAAQAAASGAKADVAAWLDDTVGERAQRARINGITIDLGTAHVEDMVAIAWQETDTDGTPLTLIELKVTDAGAAVMRDHLNKQNLKAAAVQPTTTTQPNVHPEDPNVTAAFVAAAKTVAVHQGDKQYNQSTLATFNAKFDQLAKLAAAEQAKGKAKDPQKVEMYEHYIQQGKDIKAAINIGSAPPIIPNTPWKFTPKKPATAAVPITPPPSSVTYEVSNRFDPRATTITKGFATRTGAAATQIQTDAKTYKVKWDDGTEIQFVDRLGKTNEHNGLAVEGTVQISVRGVASKDTVATAVGRLKELALDPTPPDADTREFLWLLKTENLLAKGKRSKNWFAIESEWSLGNIDAKEAVERARDYLKAERKINAPKRGQPGYTADGIQNSFGEGPRTFYRADITRADMEIEMKGYGIYHRFYNGIEADLPKMLDSGGEFTPTVDRLRKGISVASGKSVEADINTGGSSFAFTRIFETSQKEKGIWFKIGNLARNDVISYTEDHYGRISKIGERGTNPADYKNFARFGGNETLFKRGLNILDEVDFIQTGDAREKAAVIKIFKDRGYHTLPDGRKIEDIVK
jgi:SPP1 gp7 family putative phage head morphogenesis protein